jgi:hypothetical protein
MMKYEETLYCGISYDVQRQEIDSLLDRMIHSQQVRENLRLFDEWIFQE